MGQILHGSATTTEAVRRAIQHSQESLRALAKRYGINPKTIAKWKKRGPPFPICRQARRSPGSTVLSASRKRPSFVAFRRHTLLPLDDCLYALQPTIPHLTRSSFHRCLQRHGISRLPQVEGEASRQTQIQGLSDRLFSYRHRRGSNRPRQTLSPRRHRPNLEVRLRRTAREGGAPHRRRLPAPPDRRRPLQGPHRPHRQRNPLHRSPLAILSRPRRTSRPHWIAEQKPFRAHAFEYACAPNDIDHRLTKPKHPWTTDVIDKCFFAGSELFSSRARATAWRRAGREAQALPRSLHRRPSVAAPVRACLGPRGFQPATKRAYAVSACSTHLRS